MAWLYVPESAALNSGSGSHSGKTTAPCAGLSVIPTQSQSYSHECETGACTTPQSGMMCPPSMGVRGAAKLTSSQRVSHASPGAKPGVEKALPTSDGSGPTLQQSSKPYHHDSSSSRTYPAWQLVAGPRWLRQTSFASAMRCPLSWSRLQLLACRTAGAGFSFWVTPIAMDESGRGYTFNRGDRNCPGLTLPGQARTWGEWWDGGCLGSPTRPKRGRPGLSAGHRLNPAFVEVLMGLPLGWTETASAYSAMLLSLNVRHLPSHTYSALPNDEEEE
jgi:hypothetical protein